MNEKFYKTVHQKWDKAYKSKSNMRLKLYWEYGKPGGDVGGHPKSLERAHDNAQHRERHASVRTRRLV